ncbi:MAG: phospholipase D-like domain-containing protein [Pseudohongiellaceae bacterium]
MINAIIVSALAAFCGLLAASHALMTKRDSRAAFGWVAFCLFLPLAGPVIYVIFGINRLHVHANRTYLAKLSADPTRSIREPEGVQLRPMSLIGERITGKGLYSCDEITMLENGEELYPAMLEAINSATRKVYLSTYILDNDFTGWTFISALSSARNRGVDVRIIVDGLGEFMTFPKRRIGRKINKAGLDFSRFNPIRLIPPALHINMRNHRKILLVDSELAFTGGQNIGDRHLYANDANKHRVTDLHFRFRGKIVDDLERAFLIDWYHCQGRRNEVSFEPAIENRRDARIWTRLVLDGPNEDMDKLNDLMVGTISTATKRVWIMTPYFLPGQDLIGAIMAAQLRGVDMKILLPVRGNIYLAQWATQNMLLHVMEKGIRVFLQPGPFIHTKALIIDDNYSLVGSANLDPRSLRLNFELGVEVFDHDLNSRLADYFKVKLLAANEISREQMLARPFWVRFRDALAWLFSPYL